MKVGDEITIVVFERFEREATKGNPEYGSLTCDAKIVRETRTQWITAEGMRFDKGSGLGYCIQLKAVCRMNNDNNRTYERETDIEK